VLDGDDVIFTTGADTVKGKALARDGRVALCVSTTGALRLRSCSSKARPR
jgi:hypothetical protein